MSMIVGDLFEHLEGSKTRIEEKTLMTLIIGPKTAKIYLAVDTMMSYHQVTHAQVYRNR